MSRIRHAPLSARGLLLALGLAASATTSCQEPDEFLPIEAFGGPRGVLSGTVTYSGPPPCTASGRILGAAVLTAYDVRLLPPPDGLGTSAASLQTVGGETLFSGIRNQLEFESDGSLWCPPADAPSVTVSADWTMAPLPGGQYQVRGFYDLDSDFDPSFSISNLPTGGDVAGGAIQNTAEALAGAPPQFRVMTLGSPSGGSFTLPDEGAHVSGIAVTLGAQLALERPIFHPVEVRDTVVGNTDPAQVIMPSDYQLPTFDLMNPIATEESFIRIVLRAGVADAEVEAALAPPFYLAVGAPFFFFKRQDVNRDGVLDEADTILETSAIPALAPIIAFRKIDSGPANQKPVVTMQGVTMLESLLTTAMTDPTLAQPSPEAVVALRPSALCIDPLSDAPGALVITHPTDAAGTPLVADGEALAAALSAQYGRPMEVAIGCLPQGQYAINTLYETGQAWTLPNEGAICAEGEPPSADGSQCGNRARLPSQGAIMVVGPPGDPAYCEANPTPAACGM